MSIQTNHATTNAPEQPGQLTARRTRTSQRVAALAGAASVLTGVTGLAISETNTDGVEPRSTAPFVVETLIERTGDLQAGAVLAAAAAVLAMVFLGPLWIRFKQSGEWQAMIAVAGGLTLALFWLANAAQQVAFLTFAHYSNGEAARTLIITSWDTWRYMAFPFLIMALAAAMTALPVWFRVVSLLVIVIAVEALALARAPTPGRQSCSAAAGPSPPRAGRTVSRPGRRAARVAVLMATRARTSAGLVVLPEMCSACGPVRSRRDLRSTSSWSCCVSAGAKGLRPP